MTTTPRDLLIVAIDLAIDLTSGGTVGQGDLSLALAGAELLDLVDAEAVDLDGDRIVPGMPRTMDDRLLDEAVSSLIRVAPHESVEDWLWRRGRGLLARYLTVLEEEGKLAHRRHRWNFLSSGRTEMADSPDRQHAVERWTSREPVLVGLAAAVGIDGKQAESPEGFTDDAMGTVLAVVGDAVTELAAVRQRRGIEDAAFDNVWRGL
ncbi:GOLPH3/VPS74 family protein [Streptomyces sp. NPDC002920]